MYTFVTRFTQTANVGQYVTMANVLNYSHLSERDISIQKMYRSYTYWLHTLVTKFAQAANVG